MNPTLLSTVAQLSNDELLTQVKHLAGREREVTAVLIARLAELDARRLHLAEGYASLFTYCTQVLHLSEHAAYGRIQAARASRKFPVILDMLREGSVNLSTVCLLAPHLKSENYLAVLDMAQHKTKRHVEELVARLRPQPPVPDVIRRLPTRVPAMTHTPTASTAPQDVATGPLPEGDAQTLLCSGRPTAESAPPSAHRAVVTPLAPKRYKIQFTANAALHEKIRQAQALLRHQIPDGDLSQIFDRALTALLDDLGRKRLAATDRPRASRGVHRGSRHIPAAVRRAVWRRDEGRCAFVADNGRRCTEDAFLEFHHVVAHAAGGPATPENIQLRCRAHNGYEAERDLGRRTPLAVREARDSYAGVTRQRRPRPRLEISADNSARAEFGSNLCDTALHSAPSTAATSQILAMTVTDADPSKRSASDGRVRGMAAQWWLLRDSQSTSAKCFLISSAVRSLSSNGVIGTPSDRKTPAPASPSYRGTRCTWK